MEEDKIVFEKSVTKEGPIAKGRSNGKIIAYAAGEYLYCVKCHEECKDRLKKMPEKIELPDNPRTTDDIGVFICAGCEDIFGKNLNQVLPKLTSADKKVLMTWVSSKEKNNNAVAEKEKLSQEQWNAIPYRFRESKDLADLEDMITHCCTKISFVGSFFCQPGANEEPELSEDDVTGLYFILQEFEEDLKFVVNEISRKVKEGLIIEKKERNQTAVEPTASEEDRYKVHRGEADRKIVAESIVRNRRQAK